MRRFQLVRIVDVSGVSGTGVVAEGVRFSDNTAGIRWFGAVPSTVVWSSVEDAMTVHGHHGSTRLVWLDPADDPDTQPLALIAPDYDTED